LGDFLDLFRDGYMRSTILLIFINIIVNMVHFGTLLVANLTLKNLHENEMSVIMQNICIVLIGIVSGLILSPFGEIKALGRRGVLIMLSILAFIVLNMCYILKASFFLWYGLTLSLSGMISNGTIIYASELYTAKIRDRGTGLLFSVGRLGGFCGQLLYITLYEKYIWLPYYFAAVSMIIIASLIFILPYETYSIALEHVIVPVKEYYSNIDKSNTMLETSLEQKKFMTEKATLYKIV
jgi:MFS family permease